MTIPQRELARGTRHMRATTAAGKYTAHLKPSKAPQVLRRARNKVFGHKSSYCLIPLRGHTLPKSEGLSAHGDLPVLCQMSRAAADLSTALDVLAGPDEREPIAYRLTLPPSRHCALKDFRVLVILHWWANRSRRSRQHGPGHRPPPAPSAPPASLPKLPELLRSKRPKPRSQNLGIVLVLDSVDFRASKRARSSRNNFVPLV